MANRLEQARNFDPYGKGVTIDELRKIRRQLAKVMNQRMVRLENTKSDITGEEYTFGSYDKMQSYLTKQGKAPIKGTDIRRFTEKLDPGMKRRELQKEIRQLQTFEQHISSRVAGMKAIEQKRIKTFTSEGLLKKTVKNKDFYDFLNSKTYEQLLKSFTSEDIVEEYDKKVRKEKKNNEEIAEAFQEYLDNLKKNEKISLKGLRKSLGTTTIKKRKRFISKKNRVKTTSRKK